MNIGLQIGILIIDIVLFIKKKNTWTTEILKSIVYFIKGDVFCAGSKLLDVGKEIVYEEHDRIIKYSKLLPPIIFSMIWIAIVLSMKENNIQYLVAYGTGYTILKSWFTNKKSYFGHVSWFVYNIITGMYILAADEFLYIAKRVSTEMKEIEQEIEDEENKYNDKKI